MIVACSRKLLAKYYNNTLFVNCILVTTYLLVIAVPSSIPIYAITLERVRERRLNVFSQLQNERYTIIKAIDGANLTDDQTAMMNKYINPNSLTPGQIGCFLSHVSVWQRIERQQSPCTLIVEDDLLVTSSLKVMLPHLCKMNNFHIMYLGHYYEYSNGTLIATIGSHQIRKSVRPLCTHGYLVTLSGVKLLNRYLEANRYGMQIDSVMLKAYHDGYINSFSVFPPIIQQKQFKSTVGH